VSKDTNWHGFNKVLALKGRKYNNRGLSLADTLLAGSAQPTVEDTPIGFKALKGRNKQWFYADGWDEK
jgi:hypothetical protein